MWPKSPEAGFGGGSRNKTGFGAQQYLDSCESCSLAKQICNTVDLVQSGDDEIR